MGLDMFLFDKNEGEIAYWRKANQIHAWFDRLHRYKIGTPIENCENFEVTIDDLKNLVKDCITVLKDKDSKIQVLPTMSGFFFGGTNYDTFYFYDIEKTVEAIQEIIDTHNDDEVFIYSANW